MPNTALVGHRGVWTFDSQVPAEWPELIHRHGGGFFHTPLGFRSGAPDGEPVFARFYLDARVAGIAAGVKLSCRLGGLFKHLYFPAWPAFADPALRATGLSRLSGALRESAVAEVKWDSFDVRPDGPPCPQPSRWEYLLDLHVDGDHPIHAVSAPHRGPMDGGDQAGWEIRECSGLEAAAALARVGASASRATSRRKGELNGAQAVVAEHVPSSPFWGLATYVAMTGNDLLAAVLVGRSGGSAYCLAAGATPGGRPRGAEGWLQARVIARLTDEGVRRYNLGDLPYRAADPADPAHVFHLASCALGARPVACGEERWVLQAAHLRSHQLFRPSLGAAS
jgi:hypothetical protein